MISETLCGYLNHWAKERGDEIAVFERDREITYKSYANAVRGMQEFYIENDVKSGDVIAIADTKTFLGTVQYLALFGLGVSVLPMNQELNSSRFKSLLEDVDLKGFSIHRNIARKYGILDSTLEDIGNSNEFIWIPKKEIQNLLKFIYKKDYKMSTIDWILLNIKKTNSISCYDSKECRKVYFNVTSGSTGRPLIAEFGDKEIIINAISVNRIFNLTFEDCYCGLFSSDMHPHEIFSRPLVAGCKMAIFNTNDIRNFDSYVSKYKISQILCTPVVIEILLKLSADINKLASIKEILCGGESVPFSLRKKFYDYTGKKIDPVWGSTETLGTTFYVPKSELFCKESILGVPLEEYNIKIDSTTNELLISGEACFKGYLNNPSINAFNQDGYYKTKDVVSIRNGMIIFQGRLDDIVKIRGRKVSLNYIEEKISEIIGTNAYAVKLEYSENDAIIGIALAQKTFTSLKNIYVEISYIIGNGIPFRIFIFDNIPRLPSGKIDRKKLVSEMKCNTKNIGGEP